MNNLAHDMAMTAADASTGKLLDAQDDAWASYMAAKKTYNEAFNAAYDKAYAQLEKKYGIE
jgi:hypothetical protein